MLLYDVLEDCEAYMQIWDNFEYIFYLEEKAKFVLTEKGL